MHLHRVGALIFLIRISVQEPNLTLGSLIVMHSTQSNTDISAWIFILHLAGCCYLYTQYISILRALQWLSIISACEKGFLLKTWKLTINCFFLILAPLWMYVFSSLIAWIDKDLILLRYWTVLSLLQRQVFFQDITYPEKAPNHLSI